MTFDNEEARKIVELIMRSNDYVFEALDESTENRVNCLIKNITKLANKYKEKTADTIRIKAVWKEEDCDITEGDMNWHFYPQVAFGLYEYLLEVMENVLEEYLEYEKKVQIVKLRRIVETLSNEEDIIKVYNCIEEEVDVYRNDLFRKED